MSLPKYPQYKGTGVAWLDDVPAHWEITRYKQVFKERDERSVDGSETLLSVSAYTGVSPRSQIIDEGEHLSRAESLEGYKVCYPNDLVMNIMLAWNRGLGVSRYHGIVSPAYSAFRITNGAEPRFLDYMMRSDQSTSYYKAFSSGVIDSRLRLYPDTFGSLSCALPPKQEQTAIADFLDHQTAKIDALIAEQEKLLALLAEKRQATISHAVTRGLNPKVPLKDCGVPWLGDVPVHWEVRALKTIVSTPITDGPHETPEFLDEGVPFVSAEAVGGGSINFEKVRGYISFDDDARYSQKYKPHLHDIYMVKSGATTGVTAMVEGRTDFNIWSPLAAIRCDRLKADPFFVLHFLKSKNFQEAIALNWSFGTQQNIGMGVLGGLAIALPPLEEQRQIAHRLHSQLGHFPVLQEAAERAVDLLKERRSALIAAAVTGKIDVRGLIPDITSAVATECVEAC